MTDAELTGDGGHVGADGEGLRGCSCSIRCAVQQLQVLQGIGVFTVGQHQSHQDYEAKYLRAVWTQEYLSYFFI